MQLSEIRDNVRLVTLIDANTVTDAELNTIINQGLYEVSTAFSWPWLETTTDLSLTADVRYIDLPDNYDFGIALIDDDHDSALEHIGAKSFFTLIGNDTDNEGTNPEFFTIFDGKIYLHPIPSSDDAGRFTLYYYGEVSALSLDTDEPPFHKSFHWVLIEYSKWKIYEREEYYDQSERAFITYSRYLQDMMAWYGNPMKRAPFIFGDGRHSRRSDPNLPILDI